MLGTLHKCALSGHSKFGYITICRHNQEKNLIEATNTKQLNLYLIK